MRAYDFPIAAHSYFKILNLAEAKEKFLLSDGDNPVFVYSTITPDTIRKRLSVVDDVCCQDKLQLVLASLRLREERSSAALAGFRSRNAAIYGTPTKYIAEKILGKVRSRVKSSNETHWGYIVRTLSLPQNLCHDDEPYEDVFLVYKQYLERYIPMSLYKDLSKEKSTVELLQCGLELTGLAGKGWHALLREGDKHARTIHRKQLISIGREYQPRSDSAKLRIMLHEVFGHALRGMQSSTEESEGFAILLEQLTKGRLTYRRSYRYLAAAMGWGVFGKPMDFRGIYEVLWRCMLIMSNYPESTAKDHAFSECSRIFRGGVPSMKGAVFLKDTQYFIANRKVWEQLARHPLTYEEFVAIIEGRRQILK